MQAMCADNFSESSAKREEYSIILATACPTAAISTMFAIKFGKNAGYSAEIFAMTTLISMLTLPALLMMYEALTKII